MSSSHTPNWPYLWRRAFGPRCAVHEWRWERGYPLCDEVKQYRWSPCQWLPAAEGWELLRPVSGPDTDGRIPNTSHRQGSLTRDGGVG